MNSRNFGNDFTDVIKGSNLTVADDVSYITKENILGASIVIEEVNSLRNRLFVLLLESKVCTDLYCTSAQLGNILWENV